MNGSTVCRDAFVGVGPDDAVVGAVACGDAGVPVHAVMPMATTASRTVGRRRFANMVGQGWPGRLKEFLERAGGFYSVTMP